MPQTRQVRAGGELAGAFRATLLRAGIYLGALPGQQRIHHCSGTQQLADRGHTAGRLCFRRAGYLGVEICPTPRH